MNKQQGFSMLEIIIGLAVLSIMLKFLLPMFTPLMEFNSRQETESKINALRSAFETVYRENMGSIIENGSSAMQMSFDVREGAAVVRKTITTFGCEDELSVDADAAANNLAPLEQYLPAGLNASVQDGYGQPFCIAISPLQYKKYAGTYLYYHSIAIISRGGNGTLDANGNVALGSNTNINSIFIKNNSNTFDANIGGINSSYILRTNSQTGPETRISDDIAVIVDGYPWAFDAYKKTDDKLKKLSGAYETYFNVRYLMETSRNIALDYFYYDQAGGPRGDPSISGAVLRTHVDNATLTPEFLPYSQTISSGYSVARMVEDVTLGGVASPGYVTSATNGQLLGLRDVDFRDYFGKSVYLDNSSDKVRSTRPGQPVNTDIPPYSAMFLAKIPMPTTATIGQQYLTATAIGTY